MKFKKILKKILEKIYSIGTNPWVNIVVGLLFILWVGTIYVSLDAFCLDSFFAGVFYAIGLDTFVYGLCTFFGRRKKKREQDPDHAA